MKVCSVCQQEFVENKVIIRNGSHRLVSSHAKTCEPCRSKIKKARKRLRYYAMVTTKRNNKQKEEI